MAYYYQPRDLLYGNVLTEEDIETIRLYWGNFGRILKGLILGSTFSSVCKLQF